ncbi:MAG: hypothetical protein MIN69_00190 [Methylorubrum extorquens]|jgi:hypothetical protein|uniref:hypothetical protein n=1 Tax=Methylorubrum extorquens TaxID=408 RepID=UPI002FEE0E3D
MRRRANPARDAAELGCRVRRFLADGRRGGPEIADLIGHLGQLGEVAIFGGMPRDLAHGGADAFNSDVDLVVDTCEGRLAELLRDTPAKRNRFGGYRIAGRRYDYDVWALPSTWAVRSGHVAAQHLPDLVRTTFFDCDAVVYLCGSHRVHHLKQDVALRRGDTIEINLEANPNPRGIVERTMRILLNGEYAPGPRLQRYLGEIAASAPAPVPEDAARRIALVLEALAPPASASRPRREACGARMRKVSRSPRVPSPPWP